MCSLLATAANAEVKSGIDELDGPFTQFVEGKGADRTKALDAIAALERNDTREVLDGILNGDLMLHKATDTIVWASLDGRKYTMQSLDRSKDLGSDTKRKLSRLKVTNSIRSHLRSLIASLGLRSDNPVQRLAAIDALMETPEQLPDETLTELLGSESDKKVLASLHALEARKQAISDNPATRLQALETLKTDLSGSSRSLVQQMAATDVEPSVQEAAAKVVIRQAEKVTFFARLETVFFGLSLGSVLVLAAIGLAISFGVMGVINMAHGELIMLGAYCAWAMQQLMPNALGVSLLLSIPVAFLFTGLIGIFIERTVIRFLYGRPLETLLATFGISLILQQLVRTFISSQNVPVANPEFMSGVVEINSVFSLTSNRLYILAFCLVVFFLLLSLLRYTRFGLEVRAVSQNRSMARAMGVRSSRIDSLTFGLGAGIAGIAGVALSQLTNVGPNLGQAYIVDSFMVVVFGGVGNLWGTLISGMTLGIANKIMEPWAGAILAKILVLIFLIMFIQKRPRGLFPQRGRAVEAG
ncbi:urea ABC transporter permease subunit UrtB [Granulosicoccus antarcticus]|uniref:urea ABC transporter permease subunit UrtB n=1 Tax=Granulosicoccus antarcticus TaxID=437505 RepID=UPI001F02E7C5|nr:urea ABC transporter permease subunit UrtB [Granulosicoccus antarcticus]